MEDMVIPDVMNDVFYPKEDILEILCSYLYGKYVGRGVIQRLLKVPDQRQGGQGQR